MALSVEGCDLGAYKSLLDSLGSMAVIDRDAHDTLQRKFVPQGVFSRDDLL